MTDKNAPIHDNDDRPDRDSIRLANRRFLSINQDRLDRMRAALSDRQQLFLDVLPLLFHTNHPMMPGYVSRQTPCRISNYTLNKRDISAGRCIARSFTNSVEPHEDPKIYGIYVMGSVGTIAQSKGSDLDIWLCIPPNMSEEEKQELNTKSVRISEWAASLRLEAHVFLMNAEEFKQGKISTLDKESSGSTQKLLLLDEFYRTAIFMAGRTPLWWFVPENIACNYYTYVNILLQKRFVRESQVIDFGDTRHIPLGEFAGAGIWQLYKAIESPYKSVLKLLLLEAYLNDTPSVIPLSSSFKREIYEGETDIDKLDSYVMIYRRIEAYLIEKQQFKRLELARRCFYFKVNKSLTLKRTKAVSWQHDLLTSLTEEWGWDITYIEILDKRSQWKSSFVMQERTLLVNELNHSYQFLLDFVSSTGVSHSVSPEELVILGRKLQAAFERRPGKIEWINPNISSDMSTPFLSIEESYNENYQSIIWSAHSKKSHNSPYEDDPLKSSQSLTELLLWCHFNTILTDDTQVEIQSPIIKLNEVKKLTNVFKHWLPEKKVAPHESFQQSATPTAVLFLLNVGKSPMPELEGMGIQRLSGNAAALRYSGFQENLVVSVDLVICNSWSEVSTRRFDSKFALLDALQHYLQLSLPGTHQTPPEVSTHCINNTHSNIIEHRINEWLQDIIHIFYHSKSPPWARYIFSAGGRMYTLQFVNMQPVINAYSSLPKLLMALGEPQRHHSPVIVDRNALRKHPLAVIPQHTKDKIISIFYRKFDIGFEVYCIDEKGSYTYLPVKGNKDAFILKTLHKFLRAVTARQANMNQHTAQEFGVYPIEFYEMMQNSKNDFVITQKGVSTEIRVSDIFDVKAIAHLDSQNTIHYDFYCSDQEFSALSFGNELFLVVAQFILSHRKLDQHYPIYIGDLDLTVCANQIVDNGALQISHYLTIKQTLEAQLNQALSVLSKT